MSRREGWDLSACRRVALGLTEREPVRGMYSVYRSRREMLFDAHYEFELGIVCRGRMARRYQSWRTSLGPGEVWLCGLWEPHTGFVVETPCEAAVAVILPQMLADMRFEEAHGLSWASPFICPPRQRPRLAPESRGEALALGRRLRRLAAAPGGVERRVRLRLWLIEMLLLLQRDWRAQPGGQPRPGDAYARINRAVELVMTEARPIDTAEAARACSLSRSQFDRVFTRLMGMSFGRFELRRRLHGAARQLLEGDAPLKAVATTWGFADASHLARRFAEYYGCPPGEYRRRVSGGRGTRGRARI